MPINRAGTVADQGTYFTANNGSTGVATAAAPTAYSDTAPFFTIQNLGTLGSQSRSIYLDYIRIYETVAGTGGVAMFLKAQLDQVVPTGGTLLTAKSPDTIDGSSSIAAIRLLPTGIAATGNVRVIIGNHWVVPTQTTPIAVNTEVYLTFSGGLGEQPAFTTMGGAVVATFSKTAYSWPPIVISPGWALQVEHLITSQAAASSWAFEFGWIEN